MSRKGATSNLMRDYVSKSMNSPNIYGPITNDSTCNKNNGMRHGMKSDEFVNDKNT
jgi:hypothetical protein